MSKPRKKLKPAEEHYLWVSSGGICAFDECHQPLVFDDIGTIVNVADKAHVIAHSTDGPRGDEREKYGLSEEDIDSYKNLILFCKNHHKIVDDNEERYTPDILFEMKRKHEDWVRTRLQEVQSSIAIIHKTMGPPTDHITLANKMNLKMLGLISFQERLDDSPKIPWDQIKNKNLEKYRNIMELMKKYEGTVIDIFPLSQIPLLIHLGSLITDTIPVNIFQYDRNKQEWVLGSPGKVILEELGLKANTIIKNSKVLVVSIGITSKIEHEDITEVINLEESDFLEITVQDPKVDKVIFSEQVAEVKSCFKRKVEELIQENRYKEIHLFYAGPSGLAVEIGRSINANMWPHVHLYHFMYRNNPRYEDTFCI
ncbi:SAVED domain-containing protein [Desulforamulus ruminis]|uniref:SAVED domain-containing protein n=1 Tax=Desulforamulus ruminis TaxID=1564 RepID=UPI00235783FE|nr:SAVED domain-containing protein [Desulforamulus ruminis]